VTDVRLIIVRYHSVDINADDIRLLHSETPYEKFLQNFPENPHFEYRKGFAETFYGVGGCHIFRRCFNCSGISGIFRKVIEKTYMPGCSVGKPTEQGAFPFSRLCCQK
jgi:hypothetical protein